MKNFYISKSLNLFQLSCLIIFLLQNPQPIQAQDIIHSCPSTSSNFTSGSKFETYLKTLLLPSLISNGPINGFFNTSFGNNPDTVYGLVQCTDDLSIEECKNCLNISSSLIFQRCLNHQDAGIRLKSCVLHYSNVNFFSQYNGSTPDYEWDGPNVSDDEDKYNSQLGFLMNNLVSDAISKPSKFQTGSIRYNNFSSVYGMVQCSRDLSSKDCSSCLQTMVNEIQVCCSGKRGGIVLSLNCFVRFSNSVFFQSSSSSSPPLPTIGGSSKPAPPGVTGKGKRSSLNVVVIVVPTIIGGALLLLAIWLCLFKRKRWGRATKSGVLNGDGLASAESLQFDLATIRMATNDFSYANKLGESGFGTVYKGELPDGQEIAVKRLSIGSGQGSQEFTNEVVLIHKLQHRNLVRLLGFCLENEEQILIYEYVANRSLDKYLFDSSRKSILNWEERNKIIGGIARGLLYLHEDSRLRIIHRDLKAGNILLDENMSPKIADFGMAKLFQLDQTRGNTSRIAGTLGYMAPEYALHGLFSVKSDVFSFGVLILEIISGRKVTSFVHSASSEDLLSFAWIHWRKGTSIDVMDPTLADKLSTNEVIRSIQIGLLCVQEKVEDRPTMSSIVLMLSSSAIILPSPSKPSFFAGSSNTSHTVTNEWESDRSRSTASA